jgi:hypothetical protein
MKSLPARPSLESLRKQAKKLARETAAGDEHAIARARAQVPNVEVPLTQRNAQLVLAREYGYAGWQDLTAEVHKRLGNGLEWAAAQAHRAIHDDDTDHLKQLLAEYPALLSWLGDQDKSGLLGYATGAYGDAGDLERERWFTRPKSAELLIDAGAVVAPSVCEGILRSRARGLLHLFQRKGLLPHALRFAAALGDLEGVRAALAEDATDLTTVNEAFVRACSFAHEAVASILLERSIQLDPELGKRIDESVGRFAFTRYFIEKGAPHAIAFGPWKGFVMERVRRTILDNDLHTFVGALKRDTWLLGDDSVDFQNELIGAAALNGRGEFIAALLDAAPAILRQAPPPPPHALEWAVTYGHTDLIPLLTRIWPLPDDLPYAAATGNLTRVKQWFDESGAPRLGDLAHHYPPDDGHTRDLGWYPRTVQHVLDAALAFAVINRHFDVADFLLDHGADINTDWNSHEPASILHHLVFEDNYESMQYLIDRGIDMTLEDYRWSATATGWARYGKHDEKMAQWMEQAERNRAQRAQVTT